MKTPAVHYPLSTKASGLVLTAKKKWRYTMSMKTKKAEKNTSTKSMKTPSSRKTTVKEMNTTAGPTRPVLAGIGRSLGTLLDRTKAYFQSGEKGEA
jgi:hypothetical protein